MKVLSVSGINFLHHWGSLSTLIDLEGLLDYIYHTRKLIAIYKIGKRCFSPGVKVYSFCTYLIILVLDLYTNKITLIHFDIYGERRNMMGDRLFLLKFERRDALLRMVKSAGINGLFCLYSFRGQFHKVHSVWRGAFIPFWHNILNFDCRMDSCSSALRRFSSLHVCRIR